MAHFTEINQAPPPYSMFAANWKSSSNEACAKKLSQILANNIDDGGRGLVSEFMLGIGSTNFQLNLTILSFWTKFTQKKYFRLKTEDVNITIEFWIFELC